MSLQIGDSIIVNDGVTESDESDMDISRWQGRVVKICDFTDDDGIPLVEVEWDSLTLLQQMPKDFIAESYIDDLDWKIMDMYQYNIQKTEPRDDDSDVRRAQAELEQNKMLYVLGDASERISVILSGLDLEASDEAYERWLEYFRTTVRLPLPVIIVDTGEDDRVKIGGIARITAFESTHFLYGVITTLVYNTKKIDFPLEFLKTFDPESPYSQLIEDYKVWQLV